MSLQPQSGERVVVQKFLDLMSPLAEVERLRVLRTVATYFDLELGAGRRPNGSQSPSQVSGAERVNREPVFSGHQPISPKDFLRQKEPKTDIERAMCLAYYLAHFRDAPHFKTPDISKLNTEAAQRKFANPTYTIQNAAATGYFVAAPAGQRQLSAMGEQYVEALPDRQAARAIVERSRPRKPRAATRSR